MWSCLWFGLTFVHFDVNAPNTCYFLELVSTFLRDTPYELLFHFLSTPSSNIETYKCSSATALLVSSTLCLVWGKSLNHAIPGIIKHLDILVNKMNVWPGWAQSVLNRRLTVTALLSGISPSLKSWTWVSATWSTGCWTTSRAGSSTTS